MDSPHIKLILYQIDKLKILNKPEKKFRKTKLYCFRIVIFSGYQGLFLENLCFRIMHYYSENQLIILTAKHFYGFESFFTFRQSL